MTLLQYDKSIEDFTIRAMHYHRAQDFAEVMFLGLIKNKKVIICLSSNIYKSYIVNVSQIRLTLYNFTLKVTADMLELYNLVEYAMRCVILYYYGRKHSQLT